MTRGTRSPWRRWRLMRWWILSAGDCWRSRGQKMGPFLERALRIHQREQGRLHQALGRAECLRPNQGYLQMRQPFNGLGPSHELRDLLEYLADRLTFSPHGYLYDGQRKKLIPPRVTSQNGWHCSRQCDVKVIETLAEKGEVWWQSDQIEKEL